MGIFSRRKKSQANRISQLFEIVGSKSKETIKSSKPDLLELLDLMEKEMSLIKDQANGYPSNPIKGDVWFAGTDLAQAAQSLANFLSDKDLINEQARATEIWTKSILSVCSHYLHLVGPAMLANGKIHEQLGRTDFAKKHYESIIQDFESLLQECEEYEYRPSEEDQISLSSLKEASERIILLTKQNDELQKISDRVKVVLLKPELDEEKE